MSIYRNLTTGRIAPLPWRVRLPDGSTLTDPEQWAGNADALVAAGYEVTERNADDDAHDLAQAKTAKLAEIDARWQQLVATGWTPPGESWSLGIDVSDVTLLLGAYTLSRDAAAMGMPDEVTVIDKNGGTHIYDSTTITPLMLQYGAGRATASALDAGRRQAVAAATTLEEVADIEVT